MEKINKIYKKILEMGPKETLEQVAKQCVSQDSEVQKICLEIDKMANKYNEYSEKSRKIS